MTIIPTAQVSFVKACQHYFTNGTHGKKIEISEFKDLSREDKLELREMLIGEGYDIAELGQSGQPSPL